MKAVGVACGFALLMAGLAYGAGDRLQVWRSSYFDGSDFRGGIALNKPTVYHRDGYLPIIHSGDEPIPNDRLPKGMAALVVYCYIESSGGKLLNRSGSDAVAGAEIIISGADRKVVLRSDNGGYALVAIPVGGYEVSVKGITRKLSLEKGKTMLLPIRVGRRMVD